MEKNDAKPTCCGRCIPGVDVCIHDSDYDAEMLDTSVKEGEEAKVINLPTSTRNAIYKAILSRTSCASAPVNKEEENFTQSQVEEIILMVSDHFGVNFGDERGFAKNFIDYYKQQGFTINKS